MQVTSSWPWQHTLVANLQLMMSIQILTTYSLDVTSCSLTNHKIYTRTAAQVIIIYLRVIIELVTNMYWLKWTDLTGFGLTYVHWLNLDKHVKLMSSAIIGLTWQKSVIKFVARILPVEISARRILLLKFQSNFNQFLVLSGKKIYIYAISAIRDKTTNYILYNSTKLCRELLFQCWFNQLKLCVIF